LEAFRAISDKPEACANFWANDLFFSLDMEEETTKDGLFRSSFDLIDLTRNELSN